MNVIVIIGVKYIKNDNEDIFILNNYENDYEQYYEDDYKVKNMPFPIITVVIIAINVIVYLLLEIKGSTYDVDFMLRYGALSYDRVLYHHEYYRIITSFFMHFGHEHLISNMFVFGLLGYYLEDILHRWNYLAIYFLSGITSGIISMMWYYYQGEYCVSVGASGAIFGIIGALFFLIIMNKGRLEGITFGRIILFLILALYSGYENYDVDNAAHIGGFVSGIILMAVIYIGKNIGKKMFSH